MPYVLGVHLGATATSAAVTRRNGGQWATTAPFPLGSVGPTVPTMLCRVQDGSYVAGEAAFRQEPEHHEWVTSSFVEQVGQDVPLIVGGEFVQAHRLAAIMVEWVADQVAAREGHPAEHIAIAHSPSWGPHRTHALQQALAELGLTDVTLVPEPLAVAVDYAGMQSLSTGATLAVVSIGGSGCDATVLRRRESERATGRRGATVAELEPVGSTVESDHPGGRDLDDALLEHLCEQTGLKPGHLDVTEPADRALAYRLRMDCVRAKEALSYHPSTQLRVDYSAEGPNVELARTRFEQLARPHLDRVPELLVQAVQSAALGTDDLSAVVLAGGSARIPLLGRLVHERLDDNPGMSGESGVGPRIDRAPELVAARGAACCAVDVLSSATDRAEARAETRVMMRVSGSASDMDELDVVEEDRADRDGPEPERPPIEVEPMHIEPPPKKRAVKILKLSLAAALIIFGLVMTVLHGFDGGSSGRPGVLGQIEKDR